jgi:hypothetical protein
MLALEQQVPPFGLHQKPIPEAPSLGSGLSASCSLTRSFGSPVVFSNVSYSLRSEAYEGRDIFNLDFNAKKVSAEEFRALAHEVLPTYIRSFCAHSAYLGSEQPFLDRSGQRPLPLIPFVRLLNYWDDSLVEEAFAKSPQSVAGILRPHCEEIRRVGSGLYVVVSSQPQDPEKQWELSSFLRGLLCA